MFLTLRRSGLRGAPLLAAVCFVAGLTVGALIAPVSAERTLEPAAPPLLRSGHPAEVIRVIDGDTFEARVRIWPGMDVTTRVRLRGIDTPELHARCASERAQAEAARDALTLLLKEGSVAVAGVGQDKYGGRVDADVSTARTDDVAASLLARGFARRYAGGKRQSWCG